MPNLFENPDLISAEVLVHLEDKLNVTGFATRDETAMYTSGTKIGDTFRIKTGPQFVANEFTGTTTPQDIRESTRPVTIEHHYDASANVTSRELALEFDGFSQTVLKPAAYALAEKVEVYVATKMLEAAGQYNSASLFATPADLAQARLYANRQQLNQSGRFAFVDAEQEAVMLGLDYFARNDYAGNDNTEALARGMLADRMGIKFYSSLHLPTQSLTHGDGTATTNNTGGTTNLVGHTTLVCTAITAGTGFKIGDRLAIAGVRRPLKVGANAAAGATSVTLIDPITEIIPDGAAITVVASGLSTVFRGCLMDGRGLGVAFPPLDQPQDRSSSGIARSNGISMRWVYGYDMDTKVNKFSLDLLVGATCLDPRHALILTES